MSCRLNNGNSASTSLAKFLTDSDEQLVSHVFHVIRREAALKHGAEAKAPADIAAVNSFLNDARSMARHDSRIPDARRESLMRRIDDAQQDLINGEIPTKATFDAWLELRARLDEAQASKIKTNQNSDPTVGVTSEGLTITLNEVELAKADYQRLSDSLKFKKRYSPQDDGRYSERTAESINMSSFEARIAGEHYQRLSDAYDATDTGYELLLSQEAGLDAFDHDFWQRRKDAADSARSRKSLMIQSMEKADQIGTDKARTEMEVTRAKAKEYEAKYLENKTPLNRSEYEEASKIANAAKRVYLYTIIENSDVTKTLESSDMRSPQAWATLAQYDSVTLKDVWAAVELYFVDLDNAEVRIGRIRDGEVGRRAYLRAEARQALLDSQGKGEIDPINRRYNESIKRKRGEVSRAG